MINQADLLKEMQDFRQQASKDQTVSPSLKEEMDAMKAQDLQQNQKQVANAIYPETMEGKYLQPAYDVASPVLKGLSVLEKPISLSMGVGRSIGKLISGQENPSAPVMEELKSPYPTPAGSLTADWTEAGIGSEPLFPNSVPQNIKAQFPKASSFIENVSPNNLADAGAGAMYGSQLPGVAGSKATAMAAEDTNIAKKALIRGSDRDLKYVGELQSSGKLDSLANKVMEDPAIRKNLTNPEKMVEYLQGASTEVTDPRTGFRNKVPIRTGKLDEIGNNLSSSIKAFDKKLGGLKLDTRNFTDEIVDDIMNESGKIGSGQELDPMKIRAEVEKYTKALPNDPNNLDLNRIPYSDLVQIKRGAANRVFDMKRAGFANVENPTFAEQVAQKIWSKADNEINKIASAMDDYNVIKLNNEYSDYQKIRELYANKDVAKKYIPTIAEDLLPMAAIGTGAGLATGDPYMGGLAAGAYPMARRMVGETAVDMPAKILNTRMNYVEPALSAASNVPASMTAGGLASYVVPRNTDQILANSDQFVAKLSQQVKTPADKMLYDEVVNTIKTQPDQLANVMPVLLAKYPTIFAPDRYNRFNGQVDPALKGRAMEDLIQDKSRPALDKANKVEKLINQGILEDN